MVLRKFLLFFVCLYLNILNISCEEGTTLAFAIDDTGSMWDDIQQVKKEAKNIMNMVLAEKSIAIKDFLLVTINDPDVVIWPKTKSPDTIQSYLNNIRVHGGNDCPEMSLTGIEKALLKSRPGAYIYVFTDASAKDYFKVETIKNLCQKKQAQVVFVLTGYCGSLYDRAYTVYHDIAAVSSGQVITVDKNEVGAVLQVIKILLQGKHSVIKSMIVPATWKYVSVPFKIDEKVDHAVVSAYGEHVSLRVYYMDYLLTKKETEQIMWNNNGKVIKLFNLKPGTYYASVKGYSAVSVMVYARTDFTFDHGFSAIEPKSMKHTTKQPIAGKEEHLAINVTDVENSVSIKSAQILDMLNNDNVIQELPLRRISENFYVTDAFVSPAHMYKIAVIGVIKNTQQSITRISKTAVEPIPAVPETVPYVHIEGDKMNVDYGAEVSLTCKVSAYPKPEIEWFTASGNLLPSTSIVLEKSLHISYLKPKIKQNETFTCKATNTKGTRNSNIQVGVRPVFKPISIPAATTTANYGKDLKIQCNIISSLPIKVRWYFFGKELSNGGVYSISAVDSELTLKNMDLEMEGKYSCEASLNSDPTVKQTHSTEVKITGLEPPIITNEKTTYFGVEGDTLIKIPCNVTGFPDPATVWKKTSLIDSKYVVKGNVLYIINPIKSDNFKCEAKNKLGNDTKTFNIAIADTLYGYGDYINSHHVYVEGGRPVTIQCNITNLETRAVRWYKDGRKTSQTGTAYIIKNASELDDGNYTCRVNTDEGSNSENYILVVGYPPTFKKEVPQSNIVYWHDEEAVLDCSITSTTQTETSRNNKENDFRSLEHETLSFSGDYVSKKSDLVPRYLTTIEWSHDGKKLKSLNDIQVIPVRDWGEYKCEVSNMYGRIQRTFKVVTTGCYMTKNMTTENQPLLSDINTPTWPFSISNSDMRLKKNEEIKLSCPNDTKSPNAFQIFPSKTEIIAQCDTQDKFIINGKTYRYSDLQCKTKVESSIIRTRKQCSGPHSEMIQVGFAVNGFLNAYKVCYDISHNVPVYASAPIYLAKFGSESMKFQWSYASGIGDGKPTRGYNCEKSKQCCYEKRPLVNVDDMALGPAQVAIFKENLNSVAVWNPCDDRTSWKNYEREIKYLSLDYKTWSSWTGASDYGKKNGVLVPRYLWKVMKHNGDFSVMVYVNDEFPMDSDIRCTDECEPIEQSQDKFLYCCTLDEFSKAFDIPLDTFE